MLELHEAQYVFVRTISTGARQELIQGSPNCPKNTPCAFFLKQKDVDGYEMHFCTMKLDKGSTIHSWYRWYLGPDFFNTLKTYGRLPPEIGVEKLMDIVNKTDQFNYQPQRLNTQKEEPSTVEHETIV